MIGGNYFSGDLVGFERYAKEHRDNEFRQEMFDGILSTPERDSEMPEVESGALPGEDDGTQPGSSTPDYVNLINAYRVGQDETFLPPRGASMRFRASEVQGFFFGKMTPPEG